MADRRGLLSPIDVQGLLAARSQGLLGNVPTGEMRAHVPSLRDRIGNMVFDAATAMGLKQSAQRMRSDAGAAMDFIPGIGEAVGANEAGRAFGAGRYGDAALGASLTAVGAIPGVGDAAAAGVRKGIRAFHGSPHSFDKFSMDKIGTGEGAQAQGYGLYFTDSKRLANAYRKANPERDKGPGHLYEVNIDADPDEFLDRDRLLSEQSEHVRGAASRAREGAARAEYERRGIPPEVIEEYLRSAASKDRTGKQLVQALEGSMGPEAAAEALKQAGIPGIKYGWDSKAEKVFIVFDEKLVDIVNKYGIPAALGAGIITQEMAEQMQAQGLGT